MGQNDHLNIIHKKGESKMDITTLGIDLAKNVWRIPYQKVMATQYNECLIMAHVISNKRIMLYLD